MALTQVNDPSFVQNGQIGQRRNDHLASQVHHKPEWDQLLFDQVGKKWWLHSLISKYAKSDAISSNTFNWAEKGKWFRRQTIKSVTEPSPGVFAIVLNETVKYLAVDDIIDLGVKVPGQDGMNAIGRISAIAVDGGTDEITLTVDLIDEAGTAVGVLANTDFTANDSIVLLYNAKGECWTKPDGKFTTPDKFYNYLTKIPTSIDVCDDAANEQLWWSAGGKFFWEDYDERELRERHYMKVDNSLMFGQRTTFTDANGRPGFTGRGIVPTLAQFSLVRSFAGSILEDDIQDFLTILGTYGGSSNTWHLICGADFCRDFNKALRDYTQGGATFYVPFKSAGITAGLNFNKYQFGSKKVHLMEYEGFSDPDFLPQNTGGMNYSNYAMFLQMGNDNFKLKYKKRSDGKILKNWVSMTYGPTMGPGSGEYPIESEACKKHTLFTHVGLQMKGNQQHGALIGS